MPAMVQALPRNSNVCEHTCALKTVLQTMCGHKAAATWVAYVKPFVGLASGKEAAVQSEIAALCDEYADMFEQPGLPVHCDVDHRIDLHDKTQNPLGHVSIACQLQRMQRCKSRSSKCWPRVGSAHQ